MANPEIPPDEYLAWVKSLPIPRVDVLWPIHHHWGNPPWVEIGLKEYRRRPRYGDWLSELFGLRMQLDDPTVVVRGSRDLIVLSLGGRGHTDSIVNDELAMFVVNTDGGIEYPDYFRAHRDGGSRTRFNVLTDSFDAAAEDPGFSFCIHLRRYLPDECRPCPHVGVCGGGFCRVASAAKGCRSGVRCSATTTSVFTGMCERSSPDTEWLPGLRRSGAPAEFRSSLKPSVSLQSLAAVQSLIADAV